MLIESPHSVGAALRHSPIVPVPPQGRTAAPFRLYQGLDRDSLSVQPDTATFWLQARGSSFFSNREGYFVLRPGQWLALEHDCTASIDTEQGAVLIGVGIRSSTLRDIHAHRNPWLPGEGCVDEDQCNALIDLWNQCAASAGGDHDEATRALRCLLQGVRDAQHTLSQWVLRCPGRRSSRQHQVFARLQRVRLYLRGHMGRMVPMEELARLTSCSPWWLSRIFKRVYGQTLQEYGLTQRIEYACWLLTQTELAIAEISHDCGFDSPSSFAHRFRQHMGTTAGEYRSRQSDNRTQVSEHGRTTKSVAHHISLSGL